ncbi:hypothetical protein [Mucilaginibacter sp.]|uniref:hypothetical protein n=1 Tax=Mucilaginibacter sp. TaxID=1882438 RepID=UPI002628422F|nr:hypothetical protein [Mucilaginibacter sp.]MDB4920747.1 peptidase [Mucilaginibacter sp.]
MKKTFYLIVLLALTLGTARAQIDTTANLPAADKLYGLSKFWSEASDNFMYFDHAKIKWDSAYRAYIPQVLATKNTWQYYLVMQRFCALLKDGHTDIEFPGALVVLGMSRYRWIYIEDFNKKFIVTGIPVQFNGQVPLGSEMVSVDGIEAKARRG